MSLSQAVTAAPTAAISGTDSAELSWIDNIAAMASAQGGTPRCGRPVWWS